MGNCKPMKKPPFPAMSAHFAHTLDDMEEKYVKLQFIEISEPSGVIEKDKLDLLLKSRENKIVFNSCIYNLTTITESLYNYISTRVIDDENNYLEFNNLSLNKYTGEYSIKVIKSRDGEIIQNLSIEVDEVKKNLAETNKAVDTIATKLNDKVGVEIIKDPIDEKNITLRIFK